jgi:hypothetical protein
MNTDTPRTDVIHELRKDRENLSQYFYMVDHARQLERELTAARAEIEGLNFALKQASSIYDAVTEQRDGLRSGIDYASDQLHKVTEQRDEAYAMLCRIARKGEFMDMEGQRLVVFDWLARRHISSDNDKCDTPRTHNENKLAAVTEQRDAVTLRLGRTQEKMFDAEMQRDKEREIYQKSYSAELTRSNHYKQQCDRLAEALEDSMKHMRHSLNCPAKITEGLHPCNCQMEWAYDNATEALQSLTPNEQ